MFAQNLRDFKIKLILKKVKESKVNDVLVHVKTSRLRNAIYGLCCT